jgi:hypothetical protein
MDFNKKNIFPSSFDSVCEFNNPEFRPQNVQGDFAPSLGQPLYDNSLRMQANDSSIPIFPPLPDSFLGGRLRPRNIPSVK